MGNERFCSRLLWNNLGVFSKATDTWAHLCNNWNLELGDGVWVSRFCKRSPGDLMSSQVETTAIEMVKRKLGEADLGKKYNTQISTAIVQKLEAY